MCTFLIHINTHKYTNNNLLEVKVIMALFKKLVLASFISVAMLAAAPSAMAKPAGKIENQTPAGVLKAFDEAIASVEATQTALISNEDKDTVLALYKEAKQNLNRIESAVINREKERANGLLKKSRSAFRKGDTEKAKTIMAKTAAKFIALKKIYTDF